MSFITGDVFPAQVAIDSQGAVYFIRNNGLGAGRYSNGIFVYTAPTVPQGFDLQLVGHVMAVNKMDIAYWQIITGSNGSEQTTGFYQVGANGTPPQALGTDNASGLDSVAAGDGDVWETGQTSSGLDFV